MTIAAGAYVIFFGSYQLRRPTDGADPGALSLSLAGDRPTYWQVPVPTPAGTQTISSVPEIGFPSLHVYDLGSPADYECWASSANPGLPYRIEIYQVDGVTHWTIRKAGTDRYLTVTDPEGVLTFEPPHPEFAEQLFLFRRSAR